MSSRLGVGGCSRNAGGPRNDDDIHQRFQRRPGLLESKEGGVEGNENYLEGTPIPNIRLGGFNRIFHQDERKILGLYVH